MRRTRPVLVVASAFLVAGALTACTAAGGSSSGGGAGGAVAADGSAGRSENLSAPTAASGKAVAPVDRQIVTTGSLNLVTDHPIRIANRIEQLVEAAGGSVADSTQEPEGRASANLTLRIPSAVFESTLAEIKQQGDVRNVSIQATDVTSTVTDYEVRITNLRTSITRLQQLLAKATSSSALVDIEGSLTDRQGELERLLAQQRALTDQVAYSTLTVAIVVPAAAPAQGPNDFLAGIATGWQALVTTLAALAIGVGVFLPWAALLAVIGAAAWAIVRSVRRRARTA